MKNCLILTRTKKGKPTSVTRLNLKLRSYEYWNKEMIIDRQNLLYELSKDIWKIEI